MDAYVTFLEQYRQSTDGLLILVQVVLLALALGAFGAGLWFRLTKRGAGSNARSCASISRIASTTSALAPLSGIFGTVWGSMHLIPSVAEGRLAEAGNAMAMALSSTGVGIFIAAVALIAGALLPAAAHGGGVCHGA